MSNHWMTIATGTVTDGKASCSECFRVFNLYNLQDAEEYYYGHDCEPEEAEEIEE